MRAAIARGYLNAALATVRLGAACEETALGRSSDPDERVDKAGDPRCSDVLSELRSELRRIVDPVAADQQAKADQRALVERFGGREAAFQLGNKGATPAPVNP